MRMMRLNEIASDGCDGGGGDGDDDDDESVEWNENLNPSWLRKKKTMWMNGLRRMNEVCSD